MSLIYPVARSAVGDPAVAIMPAGEFYQPIRFGTALGVPSAFVAGDWTLTNPVTDGDLLVTISALPESDYPITDIEYRLDGGVWVSSGGTVTFTISGLTNLTSYDVEIRAISSFGASAPSDTKSATPTAV